MKWYKLLSEVGGGGVTIPKPQPLSKTLTASLFIGLIATVVVTVTTELERNTSPVLAFDLVWTSAFGCCAAQLHDHSISL